ncbi:MAG TPA: hypothetical protein VNT79_06575, partial [Phycisphaerae bacterium]|nr:hypothetical protein [Phycisphaerae bacterium]
RAHRIRPEPDYEASFTSPEDLIIKKLEFYKQGGSDKHIRDIKGVLKLRANELDWNYLAAWTQRRNVADVWNEIRAQFETRGDS